MPAQYAQMWFELALPSACFSFLEKTCTKVEALSVSPGRRLQILTPENKEGRVQIYPFAWEIAFDFPFIKPHFTHFVMLP